MQKSFFWVERNDRGELDWSHSLNGRKLRRKILKEPVDGYKFYIYVDMAEDLQRAADLRCLPFEPANAIITLERGGKYPIITMDLTQHMILQTCGAIMQLSIIGQENDRRVEGEQHVMCQGKCFGDSIVSTKRNNQMASLHICQGSFLVGENFL